MSLQPQAQAREARSPRVDAEFVVLVRCAAGKFPARITNLSATGFRLLSARPLEAGWVVTLQLSRREPVKCMIRWAAGKEAGGVFLEGARL